MICFAHRGASGHAPENTLLAINTALSMGASWIEVDVFAVENELVVIHDRRLERTTSGTGNLTSCNLSYIRTLDAGKGEKIPFLYEVLDTVAGKAGVNIEIKGKDTARLVAPLIRTYIQKGLFHPDQFLVSSFDYQELQIFSGHLPDIRTGANLYGLPLENARFAEELGVYSIHAHRNYITRSFVSDAHQRGFKVFVFTINHHEDFDEMFALGVDGIFTNYPELCVRQYERMHQAEHA